MNQIERPHGIGASDAAAAIGVCPYKTPWILALELFGQIDRGSMTPQMMRGLMLEPLVFQLYQEQTGNNPIECVRNIPHPKYKWMFCSPDRQIHGGPHDGLLVEGKTAGEFTDGWGDPGTDEIPENYIIQCQHQMEVMGANQVDVPVLFVNSFIDNQIAEDTLSVQDFFERLCCERQVSNLIPAFGWKFSIYTVHRNRRLTDKIIDLEREFWRFIENRTEPEPDFGIRANREALKTLYGVEELEINLDESAVEDVKVIAAAKQQRKMFDNMADEAKARLLHSMGNCGKAILPDGTILTRKTINRKGFTVEPTSYVDFRIKQQKGKNNDQ